MRRGFPDSSYCPMPFPQENIMYPPMYHGSMSTYPLYYMVPTNRPDAMIDPTPSSSHYSPFLDTPIPTLSASSNGMSNIQCSPDWTPILPAIESHTPPNHSKRPRNDQSNTTARTSLAQPMPVVAITAETAVGSVDFSEMAMCAPIVIMENFLNHPNIAVNNEAFQHMGLDKSHGNQSVNVLFQQLDACGWDIKGQYWMRQSLSQYLSYMRRAEKEVNAFKAAIGSRTKSIHEPGLVIGTEDERADLRCFLALSQDDSRSVPRLLQAANVSWPDMAWGDFQKVTKGNKVSSGLYKDMKARIDTMPRVQELRNSFPDGQIQMCLGDGPWEVHTERLTFDGEVYLSVCIGRIILIYGPLECSPDSPLPFSLDLLTPDVMLDELTFIWKTTLTFLSSEQLTPKAHPKPRRFDSMVQFCSNLDIGGWSSELQVLAQRLPDWIWCNGSNDILALMRQPVQGMNIPQIYLKVPGSWTGGHEENCRFRSVNCNHGPGSSEWFAIDAQYTPMLRERVLSTFGVDIYMVEGNWFPELKWLDEMGIPYMTGIQRVGDVVLLKGSTLHWVRSLGFSSHSSWNFGYLSHEQLQDSIERYGINSTVTPPIQSLVPMKTMVLDLCRFLLRSSGLAPSKAEWSTKRLRLRNQLADKEMHASIVELLLVLLIDFMVDDKLWREYVAKIHHRTSSQEPDGAMVVYCQQSSCGAEITTAYFRCDSCDDPNSKTKQEVMTFLCLECGIRHHQDRPQHALNFVHKDSIESIMHDLQQFTVYSARYLPDAANICAQRMEQAITRTSVRIDHTKRALKRLAAQDIKPQYSTPSSTVGKGKKRGRPVGSGSNKTAQPRALNGQFSRTESAGTSSKKLDWSQSEPLSTNSGKSGPIATDSSNHLVNAATANAAALVSVVQALNSDYRSDSKKRVLSDALATAIRLQNLLSEL